MRPLDARRVGAVRRVSEQLEIRPQERDDVGLVLGLGRQSQLLGFAQALRRSNLVALQVDDVAVVAR